MKKAKVFTLLFVAILVITVITAYGYGKITGFGKTIVRPKANLVAYDKNQLVNDARAIISGSVISSEAQDDFEGFPATDYLVKVDKVFKGNTAAEVEVRTEGGENAKMKYIPEEGAPTFQIGEKVVLFLTDDKGTRPDRNDFDYFLVGQFQGKFKEQNGKLINQKFIFNVATFEQEIKEIEEENQAKGLKKN